MSEMRCPFCREYVFESYGIVTGGAKCPNCGKDIPQVCFQYPVYNVASISIGNGNVNYIDDLYTYAENEAPVFENSRIEAIAEDVDSDTKIVLFEYLKEFASQKKETVVVAIHKSTWNDADNGKSKKNIELSSNVLLNIDITELSALYFNSGIIRNKADYEKRQPRKANASIRAIAEQININKKVYKSAILFGNMQMLRNHPFFKKPDDVYQKLLRIPQEWTSEDSDRKRILELNNLIKSLLEEIGEKRLMADAAGLPKCHYFLFPSSEYRMMSNTFWMMAILLWICTDIKG